LPRATPLDALRFMMDQHSLEQKAVVRVLGSPGYLPAEKSGKRELNKDHIKRLSERFRVSLELFF
jgi:HTH-type transcriptional regulator/antitoxin HigA